MVNNFASFNLTLKQLCLSFLTFSFSFYFRYYPTILTFCLTWFRFPHIVSFFFGFCFSIFPPLPFFKSFFLIFPSLPFFLFLFSIFSSRYICLNIFFPSSPFFLIQFFFWFHFYLSTSSHSFSRPLFLFLFLFPSFYFRLIQPAIHTSSFPLNSFVLQTARNVSTFRLCTNSAAAAAAAYCTRSGNDLASYHLTDSDLVTLATGAQLAAWTGEVSSHSRRSTNVKTLIRGKNRKIPKKNENNRRGDCLSFLNFFFFWVCFKLFLSIETSRICLLSTYAMTCTNFIV